ncbi:MAG: HNH endonuclease [Bacteroidales bacterium]|jgi:hypothetical protein
MPFKKGFHPKTEFKKGHTSWCKKLHIQTNTGKTHFKKGVYQGYGFKKGVYQGYGFKKGCGGFTGKHTEESKTKMSVKKIGRKHTEKAKRKMSIAQSLRRSKEPRKERKRYVHTRDKKYLQWRSNIFQRDNWTCRTCGITGCYLEVHHIKSWAKYPELRYDVENGITLCKECHKLTNNYKNKKICQ